MKKQQNERTMLTIFISKSGQKRYEWFEGEMGMKNLSDLQLEDFIKCNTEVNKVLEIELTKRKLRLGGLWGSVFDKPRVKGDKI